MSGWGGTEDLEPAMQEMSIRGEYVDNKGAASGTLETSSPEDENTAGQHEDYSSVEATGWGGTDEVYSGSAKPLDKDHLSKDDEANGWGGAEEAYSGPVERLGDDHREKDNEATGWGGAEDPYSGPAQMSDDDHRMIDNEAGHPDRFYSNNPNLVPIGRTVENGGGQRDSLEEPPWIAPDYRPALGPEPAPRFDPDCYPRTVKNRRDIDKQVPNDVPNRFELFLLGEGEKKVTITPDTRIPSSALFLFKKEDHTLGNLLRSRLLSSQHVTFAGYKVPHPLFAEFELRVQTDGEITPKEALVAACRDIVQDLAELGRQFTKEWELRKIAKTGAGQTSG